MYSAGFSLRVTRNLRIGQFIEQAPGPRGSPQLPHPPAGALARAGAAPACAANTDCLRSRVLLWQAGHSGVSDERTNTSNWFAHDLQAYSYNGMAGCSPLDVLN